MREADEHRDQAVDGATARERAESATKQMK
ncbi:MAG: hypothetical protein RLZZ347_154 [Candidatus Parcubacteria bacterium]|jgi:hypothetical protein